MNGTIKLQRYRKLEMLTVLSFCVNHIMRTFNSLKYIFVEKTKIKKLKSIFWFSLNVLLRDFWLKVYNWLFILEGLPWFFIGLDFCCIQIFSQTSLQQNILWYLTHKTKDLSLCHKPAVSNPDIFATWWWKPLIFQT